MIDKKALLMVILAFGVGISLIVVANATKEIPVYQYFIDKNGTEINIAVTQDEFTAFHTCQFLQRGIGNPGRGTKISHPNGTKTLNIYSIDGEWCKDGNGKEPTVHIILINDTISYCEGPDDGYFLCSNIDKEDFGIDEP